MGKLRIIPNKKDPGFLSFQVNTQDPTLNSSNIQLQTRHGTQIQISKEMPLRQVARLIKLLEHGGGHGLG